jgi:hypothetical protein
MKDLIVVVLVAILVVTVALKIRGMSFASSGAMNRETEMRPQVNVDRNIRPAKETRNTPPQVVVSSPQIMPMPKPMPMPNQTGPMPSQGMGYYPSVMPMPIPKPEMGYYPPVMPMPIPKPEMGYYPPPMPIPKPEMGYTYPIPVPTETGPVPTRILPPTSNTIPDATFSTPAPYNASNPSPLYIRPPIATVY